MEAGLAATRSGVKVPPDQRAAPEQVMAQPVGAGIPPGQRAALEQVMAQPVG